MMAPISYSSGSDPVEERRRTALAAVQHLRTVTPRFGELIDRIGPHRPIITRNPFTALLGSIIQQQVSMSAASAIYNRLKALCPRRRPTPAAILELDDDTLRGIGLSRQKVAYVRNIGEAFATRALTTAGLRRMSDEEVLAATTRIKGVGRWTAEMLLIFCLERPDVWPVDDLGLKKALRDFLGRREMLPPAEMQEAGELWRPYRSYATWYLWRSLEGPMMPGVAI